MTPDYRLYTFSLSHFSEKIRWMLDNSGVPHKEIRWTPFFHIVPALIEGRHTTTVPILQAGSVRVQGSTAIMLWLDQHEPHFQLIPVSLEQRREVLQIVERFDRVGAHVIRYVYSAALEHSETVKGLWTLDANRLQRAVVNAGFPALRTFMHSLLRITPDNVSRSGKNIDEAIQWLEDRVSNRNFLVGERLSAADISAAALLAPLACPAEHPVYAREDFRAAIRPLREPRQKRRGIEWVCSLYRDLRRSR